MEDFKFPIKILEERLSQEKTYLKIFSQPVPIEVLDGWEICDLEKSKKYLEWQKSNVESCQYRINALEECIAHLKSKE